jgi:hypothetical protein
VFQAGGESRRSLPLPYVPCSCIWLALVADWTCSCVAFWGSVLLLAVSVPPSHAPAHTHCMPGTLMPSGTPFWLFHARLVCVGMHQCMSKVSSPTGLTMSMSVPPSCRCCLRHATCSCILSRATGLWEWSSAPYAPSWQHTLSWSVVLYHWGTHLRT